MNEEEVGKILEDFEKQGIVYKRWDVKKQDYVWCKTEYGEELAKEMLKDET
jgi:hypothetical protein